MWAENGRERLGAGRDAAGAPQSLTAKAEEGLAAEDTAGHGETGPQSPDWQQDCSHQGQHKVSLKKD